MQRGLLLIRRAVTPAIQILFKVLALNLDRASQLYTWYLTALEPSVGPALAHTQSPADLIQGEQLRDTAIGTFDNIPALSSGWISNPSSSRPHSPSSPLQSTSSQTQGTSSRLEVESSMEQVPPQG